MTAHDPALEKRAFEKRYFTWTVLTAPVFMVVAGAFLQKFILLAGISKTDIGWAVGLMSLVPPCTSYFFVSLIERKGLKHQVFALAYIFRFALVALLALLPSILWPDLSAWMAPAYVVLTVLIALAYTFGNLCLESMVQEAIPPYRFGQFAAKVSAYSSLASLLPGVAVAFLADRFSGLVTLQAILVVGGLTGALLTACMMRGHGFSQSRLTVHVSLLSPLRDRTYRLFVLLFAFQTFFVTGSSAFWGFFIIEELQLSLFAMVLIGSCCSLFVPVFAWIWGIVNDHFGPRATFLYASVFSWISCLLLVIPMPAIPCAVLFCLLVGFYGTNGFFSCGRGLAGRALRNAMIPPEQSATYIGLFQLVTGVLGFFSGLAAGFALKALAPVAPVGFSPYRILFLIGNVIFGCLTTLMMLPLRERSIPGIDIRKLGMALMHPSAFMDFLAIAMVNTSHTPKALERTVKRLATRSTYLGRTALLRHFRSPSVRIRRQAVKGLRFLNDPDVFQALKSEILSGHSPVLQECMDALETLDAEDVFLDLFAGYHRFPREVRMRLVLAALTIDSKALNRALDQVLPEENELDIASELILGRSGCGIWRMGLAALDRLENSFHVPGQADKLWMALGLLFGRSLKVPSLMSEESQEAGVAVCRRDLVADERLLQAYMANEPALFHELAFDALREQKPRLFACYQVVEKDRSTVDFLVGQILHHVRDHGERMAMLVVMIILYEIRAARIR